MSMSDPIADMLTRIRNAQMVEKEIVQMPLSKIKISIAQVLKEEGYIENYTVKTVSYKNYLEIVLKYYFGRSVIGRIERASKPGLRLYKKCNKIPTILNGLGIAIVTTSKGVMTDRKARKVGIGGEILCYVS
jgi:small subunit ribosomal protein S8